MCERRECALWSIQAEAGGGPIEEQGAGRASRKLRSRAFAQRTVRIARRETEKVSCMYVCMCVCVCVYVCV